MRRINVGSEYGSQHAYSTLLAAEAVHELKRADDSLAEKVNDPTTFLHRVDLDRCPLTPPMELDRLLGRHGVVLAETRR